MTIGISAGIMSCFLRIISPNSQGGFPVFEVRRKAIHFLWFSFLGFERRALGGAWMLGVSPRRTERSRILFGNDYMVLFLLARLTVLIRMVHSQEINWCSS